MTETTTVEVPQRETKKPTRGKKSGAKKGTANAKKAKARGKRTNGAFQKAGKVGVIDTIIEECLQGATKGQIYEKLAKRFPNRPLKGMRATVHIYLGGRLTRDKGYKIHRTGKGKEAVFTVTPPKTGTA